MIKYCKSCLLPSTKPDLYFDNEGKCAACIAFDNRPNINWAERKKEFEKIVISIKGKSDSSWDCVIPVSGGKDSTTQVLKALEYGLRPLCVTSTTCDLSLIGRKNIENIKNLGVDYIEVSPNPRIRARLNKLCLEQVGDISWPEHVGIFTIPVNVAVQYKIPLIIWGENSQNEYGGPSSASESNSLDRRWLEEFGGLLGLRVSDLDEVYGFHKKDLIFYQYPTEDEIKKLGIYGLFLGHYFPWDGISNFIMANANGFQTNDKVLEGSIVNFENIDNYQTGIHDYFKFLKYGFGRATDIASLYIRRKIITRSQALELVKANDGKYPQTYLGKPLQEILNKIDLSINQFDEICDRFANRSLFSLDKNGELLRDENKNLIKINYDNI